MSKYNNFNQVTQTIKQKQFHSEYYTNNIQSTTTNFNENHEDFREKKRMKVLANTATMLIAKQKSISDTEKHECH